MGTSLNHLNIAEWLEQCSLEEFLEAVTYIYDGLPDDEATSSVYGEKRFRGTYPKKKWLQFVQDAFEDENVGYRVRSDAAVTFYVDEKFEAQRQEVISGLDGAKFETAREHFDRAFELLKRPGQEGEAVAMLFKCAENIFKLSSGLGILAQKAPREFYSKLSNLRRSPESHALNSMLTSMGEWVAACHQYRHADGNQAPTPPGRDTAIWLISSGVSHIRWMLDVYHAGQGVKR